MRVEQICAHEVVDIAPDASLIEAAETMRRCHVGALVVCQWVEDQRTPVGFLTDRDIVVSAVAVGLAVETLTVGDVMTQPAMSCSAADDLVDAIAAMHHHGVRRLPVVDAHGVLVGIVSADDLWREMARQVGVLSEAMTQEQVREIRRRV
jgi:CBS domain-containing protein